MFISDRNVTLPQSDWDAQAQCCTGTDPSTFPFFNCHTRTLSETQWARIGSSVMSNELLSLHLHYTRDCQWPATASRVYTQEWKIKRLEPLAILVDYTDKSIKISSSANMFWLLKMRRLWRVFLCIEKFGFLSSSPFLRSCPLPLTDDRGQYFKRAVRNNIFLFIIYIQTDITYITVLSLQVSFLYFQTFVHRSHTVHPTRPEQQKSVAAHPKRVSQYVLSRCIYRPSIHPLSAYPDGLVSRQDYHCRGRQRRLGAGGLQVACQSWSRTNNYRVSQSRERKDCCKWDSRNNLVLVKPRRSMVSWFELLCFCSSLCWQS